MDLYNPSICMFNICSPLSSRKKKKKTWKMLSGSNLTTWKWCLLYLLMFSLVKQLTWQSPTSRVAGVMVRPEFKKEEKYRHKITEDGDLSHEIKRHLLLERKVMTNLDSIFKKQRYYLSNKGLFSQGYGFPSGHVWMWELDCEEGWAPKNWCFWTVVLEKTLESPLDCKEIQPVHPKGD